MGLKYKDPTTGQFKEISVKVADSLPIGTEVDYDGETVPTGWEEVDNILWENLSPEVEFTSQTITLKDNFSNYSYFEIIYRQATGSDRLYSTGKILVGHNTTLNLFNQYFYKRYVNVGSVNTIQFLDGFYYATYGSGTTTNDNGVLIPIQVIGYR